MEVERSLKSVVKTKKFMINENIKRALIYRKRLTLIMQMINPSQNKQFSKLILGD